MKYKILVDSCTDLPVEFRKDERFKIIPLSLMVDDKVFVDNGEFDQKEFLKIMKESQNGPKSACPSRRII